MSTEPEVSALARRAGVASRELALATRAVKDAALQAMADALDRRTDEVLAANAVDIEAGPAGPGPGTTQSLGAGRATGKAQLSRGPPIIRVKPNSTGPVRTGRVPRRGPSYGPSGAVLLLLSARCAGTSAVITPRDMPRQRDAQPLRWVTSPVRAGRTTRRSPTTPKSTSSKIGASSSLLTATIVLEVCMPARCWMAPEMPAAM